MQLTASSLKGIRALGSFLLIFNIEFSNQIIQEDGVYVFDMWVRKTEKWGDVAKAFEELITK